MTEDRLRFRTTEGLLVPAVSAFEMREVDRIAADQTGPGLLQMMEDAGRSLALAALDLLGDPGWRHARVLVLAGSGNNGAGGVCAGRHLANRGVAVQVVTITHPYQADGALGQQFLALAETPARVMRWDEAFVVADADLVIDAVLGYALTEAPRGPQMALIRAARHAAEAGVPVLSLDVPSGLHPDTGEAPGDVVWPVRTLTLGLPKRGLRREACGDLWVADVGIPPGVYARAGVVVEPFFGAADRVPLRYPGE